MGIKISLITTGMNMQHWKRLLDSLRGNTVTYELIITSSIDQELIDRIFPDYPELKYIHTNEIKPAQAIEVAFRNASGECLGWILDDCIFPEGALDKIWEFYTSYDTKTIIAVKNTDPQCNNNNLNEQRFFSCNLNTPQMALIGFMSTWYLKQLGGSDQRYIYGKWNDDICMRVLADGGKIVKFEDVEIIVNRVNKNWVFNNNWSGANEDGENLENSWVIGGYTNKPKPMLLIDRGTGVPTNMPILSNTEVTLKRNDSFKPYIDKDIITKSQGLGIKFPQFD